MLKSTMIALGAGTGVAGAFRFAETGEVSMLVCAVINAVCLFYWMVLDDA